jgi:hypothetical protein
MSELEMSQLVGNIYDAAVIRRHLEYCTRSISHERRKDRSVGSAPSDRNHERQRDSSVKGPRSSDLAALRSDPIAETLHAFGLGAMLTAIELIVSF